jgi:DNA-binding CsgD family transcriptional regulator
VPTEFLTRLLDTLPLNPITKTLYRHIGQPVDMADVVADDDFYASEIYQQCFQPYSIERILSSIHVDSRSGIFTLISLYRSNREHRFTAKEKENQTRLLFHLLNASSHACLLQLSLAQENTRNFHSAICDKHGVYHEVEPAFLDIIESHFPNNKKPILPFSMPEANGKKGDQTQVIGNLHITITTMGDLYKVDIREASPLDKLTAREIQVVNGISEGLSFKIIAKQLNLSPSTISNHLYRVYQKLDISSRADLAAIVRQLRG